MTCRNIERAIVPLACVLMLVGCEENTEERDVVGVYRLPQVDQGCEEVQLSFTIAVEEGGFEPTELASEWCALMERHMVCFLHEHAGNGPTVFKALREQLVYSDVPQGHAELPCWSAEIAAWDEFYGEDADYHPVWSNDAEW
jgi:hypothetical protein